MSMPMKKLSPTTPLMSATVYTGDSESYELAMGKTVKLGNVAGLLQDGSPITHGLFVVCWYWWTVSTGFKSIVPACAAMAHTSTGKPIRNIFILVILYTLLQNCAESNANPAGGAE